MAKSLRASSPDKKTYRQYKHLYTRSSILVKRKAAAVVMSQEKIKDELRYQMAEKMMVR